MINLYYMLFSRFAMLKTPQQKWKEAIVAYRKKCQKILELSKSIRYAGIINEYRRTLTGMVRPNTIPLWSAEEVKNEFFIISTLIIPAYLIDFESSRIF